MKLHLREWPGGPKLAILLHGLVSDSGSWNSIAPELNRRGYRVLAPDLRGHGRSPRGSYSVAAWTEDLLESLPTGADLVLGHSLGGVLLAAAVAGLGPSAAVYEDPAWVLEGDQHDLAAMGLRWEGTWSEEEVRAESPRWSDADVHAKVEAAARWDPATADGFFTGQDLAYSPDRLAVPSLVLLADPTYFVPAPVRGRLTQLGFEVVTVPGSGHSIHRDDPRGFLLALDRWLAKSPRPAP